jgi:hypothetical protein
MYKNYISLENFNHKSVIIFLGDDKMASPMSVLPLGSGKMVPDCGGSIMVAAFPVTTFSPKGLSNGTQRHVTCNLQAQNSNLLQE